MKRLLHLYAATRVKRSEISQRDYINRLRREERVLSAPISIPKAWREEVEALRSNFRKKFSRLVVWGQRYFMTPYSFIRRDYYCTAKRLGIPTIWLEDDPSLFQHLWPGDLLIVQAWEDPIYTSYNKIDTSYSQIKAPVSVPGVFYCLDCSYFYSLVAQLTKDQYLLRSEDWNSSLFGLNEPQTISDGEVYYNPQRRVLCRPYGTDLLPWEFLPPVFCPDSREVNYVGMPSRDNADVLDRFRGYLKTVGLNLRAFQRQTSAEYRALMRQSRLAPFLGDQDVTENHVDNRLFRNISYGQLGYSNAPMHQAIYKGCHPQGGSIEEMSDTVLRMSEDDYISMIREQQKVTQGFTFLQHLADIFKYF